MEAKTVYFEKEGTENTDATLALVKQRADELGIKTVIVASTRGDTAAKAVDVFQGMKVVVVTHAYGSREPNVSEFNETTREVVESKGGKILTATHGFGGVHQSLQSTGAPPRAAAQPGGGTPAGSPGGQAPQGGPPAGGMPSRQPVPGEIIGATLGVFGRGMKVACEIVIMAADAGLVRTDEEVIAVAGSGRGADLAIVVLPANANRFFQLKVKEIICKPRL